MADFPALQKAVAVAESAKAYLIEERQGNRTTMPKAAFRAYNLASRQVQIDVQTVVTVAEKALQDALKVVRSDAVAQVIGVGTVSESNTVGGAS